MKNCNNWLSIAELMQAQIDGLPTSDKGISKKAEREGWTKRQREGVKGKTFEYFVGDMPANIQEKLGFGVVKKECSELVQRLKPVTDQLVQIPFFNTFASAGFGAVNEDKAEPDDFIGLSEQWLWRRGLHKDKLLFILTTGDSMYPTIKHNDMLLVNRNSTTPKDGQIYVLRVADQLWVKRVQGLVNGIRLISDNKELYNPIDLHFNDSLDVDVLGQVVFVGRDLI